MIDESTQGLFGIPVPWDVATLTVLLGTACNLFGFAYSWIVLYTGAFRDRRISKKPYAPGILRKHLPQVIVNIAILNVLTFGGLVVFRGIFDDFVSPWWMVVTQVAFMLVVDDLWFYGLHRLMHENRTLMRVVHRKHHEAFDPFPLDYIYVHPLEWMGGAIGPALALVIMHAGFGWEISVWAFWAYSAFRNIHEIDIHSGVASVLFKYVPFWGTVEHHHRHHSHSRGNYASTFTYLDRLFGTMAPR